MLTQEELKKHLFYDPTTGVFIRKFATGSNRHLAGKIAGGYDGERYWMISVLNKRYRAHRLAWLYVYGTFPNDVIDHIDGNGQNNSIENLRDVTTAQNIQNQNKPHSKNKTGGLLGVSFHKAAKKFQAHIKTNGKNVYLGLFLTADAAHESYLNAKRELHETCTI